MTTPGRRKALKSLAKKKRQTKKAVLSGKKTVTVGGKKIKTSSFLKKIGGKPKSWPKIKRTRAQQGRKTR